MWLSRLRGCAEPQDNSRGYYERRQKRERRASFEVLLNRYIFDRPAPNRCDPTDLMHLTGGQHHERRECTNNKHRCDGETYDNRSGAPEDTDENDVRQEQQTE